jgi:hypothetical protein
MKYLRIKQAIIDQVDPLLICGITRPDFCRRAVVKLNKGAFASVVESQKQNLLHFTGASIPYQLDVPDDTTPATVNLALLCAIEHCKQCRSGQSGYKWLSLEEQAEQGGFVLSKDNGK